MKFKSITLFFLIVSIQSCELIIYGKPDIDLTITGKSNSVAGKFARLHVLITNNGQGQANEISGTATIYRNHYIIQRSVFSVGYLEAGQSMQTEIWFSKIDRHSEYDHLEITYSYSGESGWYYEEDY